jgi:magnesium chelatase family protein
MFAKEFFTNTYGIDAYFDEIEVDLGFNFYATATAGLPDNAVKEAVHGIAVASRNTGCKLPIRRIVVNVVSADIKKEGFYGKVANT